MTELNHLNDNSNSGKVGSEIRMSRNYLEDVRTMRAVKAARNEIQDELGTRGSIVSNNAKDSHYTPRPIRDFSGQEEQKNIHEKTINQDMKRDSEARETNISKLDSGSSSAQDIHKDLTPQTGLSRSNKTRRDIPDFDNMVEITVIGVGGGGSNSVGRMEPVPGVTYIIANTDSRALAALDVDQEIHLGRTLTRGKGAGGRAERGKAAAEEARDSIGQALDGSEIVFITACLGGGTGSGAGPVIAEIANNLTIGEDHVLTVAIVTMPFSWEGSRKRAIAEDSLENFRRNVDAVIVIENDLLPAAFPSEEDGQPNLGIEDEFRLTDKILSDAIQGLSEIITVNGVWNLDIADFRSTMENAGDAVIAIGSASGDNRAVGAAQRALANPLINTDITNAKRLLINVVGPASKNHQSDKLILPLTRDEIRKIKEVVGERAHPTECDVFTGVMLRNDLEDEIHVTIVAADFENFEATSIDMALDQGTRNLEKHDLSSIPKLEELRKSLATPIISSMDIRHTGEEPAPSVETIKTSIDSNPDELDGENTTSDTKQIIDFSSTDVPYYNKDIPER
ncbi:MAG: cell division protein FtsZ [Dehalococcoidia bacterium]|nr:cell division protein FtsZ [Dehalococcoidia bacterium]